MSAPDDAPAGIREVMDLVERSEQRTAARINDLGNKIDTVVVTHEHRLTTVEATQTNGLQRLSALEKDVGDLKTDSAENRGRLSVWKAIASAALVLLGGIATQAVFHVVK